MAGPTAAPGRAHAFSATKQRLYVIGGVALTGAPLNQGFMLDLEGGAWRSFSFPSGESVGTVRAATYRWQDQSVYFLDNSGTSIRLRRWNAQRVLTTGVVQTLATFPSAWGAFPKVNLINTPDGHMLLVGWAGTGSEKTRVGLVTVSDEGVVALARVRKSTTAVMAPPGAGATGYTTVTQGAVSTASPAALPNPYAVSVTYSAMENPSLTDFPTVHPH